MKKTHPNWIATVIHANDGLKEFRPEYKFTAYFNKFLYLNNFENPSIHPLSMPT